MCLLEEDSLGLKHCVKFMNDYGSVHSKLVLIYLQTYDNHYKLRSECMVVWKSRLLYVIGSEKMCHVANLLILQNGPV